MNKLFQIITAAIVLLFFSGCMGTFETARVVPFKIGATYFTTINSDDADNGDDDDDDTFGMPGIIIETGWPAGPSRFGVGLHLRAAGVIDTDDDGFILVWGGKLQLPQNSFADIALGVDIWGYYPGEIKLFVSRQLGLIEPYGCVGVVGFLDDDDDDDDDDTIDIFGDGVMTYTLGTMVEFGSGSGWMLAAEIEGGDVWVSPGVGVGLIKEF